MEKEVVSVAPSVLEIRSRYNRRSSRKFFPSTHSFPRTITTRFSRPNYSASSIKDILHCFVYIYPSYRQCVRFRLPSSELIQSLLNARNAYRNERRENRGGKGGESGCSTLLMMHSELKGTREGVRNERIGLIIIQKNERRQNTVWPPSVNRQSAWMANQRRRG